MNIFILILIITIGCWLLYCLCKCFFSFSKKDNKVCAIPDFKINISSNKFVDDYVEKTPQQYKTNSRILSGRGKMHFIETMSEGSKIAKEKSISVLNTIGDRFS